MTDWTDIPGNTAVRDELLDILARPTAIAVVGAGASVSLGYPTWKGLLQSLIKRLDPAPKTLAAWTADLESRPQRVAKAIRRAFPTDGALDGELYKLFGPTEGPDGRRFAATHASLLQLPFRGYLTTNYDPCLDEARRALRPDSPGGIVTWRDPAVSRWHSDAVFDEHPCPILWGHGHYDDAESLVFDVDGYRRVYLREEGSAYQQTFRRLWTQKHLVFVGFGFSDPWLDFLIDQGVTHSGQRRVEGARHVAILGMPEDRLEALRYHRESFADEYHAKLLAYSTGPDGKEDHSQLGAILDYLVERSGRQSTTTEPRPAMTRSSPGRLAAYRDLVLEEHSKLHGPLHLPEGMDQIRHASVDVIVDSAQAREHLTEIARQPTLDDLLALEPGQPPWQQGRWLLVGDPGTGKTTLLRRIAVEMASGEADRLPLFQPLPELIAHSGDLLDLWEQRFLRLTGRSGFGADLDAEGAAGRLVLMLDGFDEVDSDLHGASVDRIRGFVRRWPDSRIVVTTRPHGRGETTPEGFVELSLQPLTPDARAEYLDRWFAAAGEADPADTTRALVEHVSQHRSLDHLSRNPLYLTLLAGLWDPRRPLPRKRSQLYDRIFDHLFHGRHKPKPHRSLPAHETVAAMLAELAHDWTDREEARDTFGGLSTWLLGSPHWNLLRRATDVWRQRGPERFWRDLWERTQILGPEDGPDPTESGSPETGKPWRFWHRTFREALAAQHLSARIEQEGEASVFADVERLDEGRWAEPFSILAGRLDPPDELVEKLMVKNRRLGLRTLATVEGLKPATLARLMNLTGKPEERAEVYEEIPDQVSDPAACLALWDRLAERERELNDVYCLHWLLDEIGRRWPASRRAASAKVAKLYDALPDPTDPDLFRFVETNDGRVDLWPTIPKGEGWIGSPKEEEGRYPDEGPRHRVTITRPFALAAVPVTNAQWAQLDPTKADLDRPNHPVVKVTWWEAMTFCHWLDHKLGYDGARLPTEEEWEYACRAGSETRFYSGNEVADLDRTGWYDNNSNGLQPVGQKQPNRWKLYDMHGNVREWTASAWKGDYSEQKGRLTVDPADPPADLAGLPRAVRVVRGGSVWNSAGRARSAYRVLGSPWLEDVVRGFRVLLPSPERS